MGKNSKKTTTRGKLLKKLGREDEIKTKNEEVLTLMLNDDTIQGEHIEHYNKVVHEYEGANIPTPIDIRDNVQKYKLMTEYFKVALEDKLKSESSSLTENMKTLLSQNNYVTYMETLIKHYDA